MLHPSPRCCCCCVMDVLKCRAWASRCQAPCDRVQGPRCALVHAELEGHASTVCHELHDLHLKHSKAFPPLELHLIDLLTLYLQLL